MFGLEWNGMEHVRACERSYPCSLHRDVTIAAIAIVCEGGHLSVPSYSCAMNFGCSHSSRTERCVLLLLLRH